MLITTSRTFMSAPAPHGTTRSVLAPSSSEPLQIERRPTFGAQGMGEWVGLVLWG